MIVTGRGLIVHKLYVAWIVVRTGFVNQVVAGVISGGLEAYVISSLATQDARNMANAKMELAFVHKDGMDDTVLYRVVKMDVLAMVNVHSKMASIAASVLKAGLEMTALFHWR